MNDQIMKGDSFNFLGLGGNRGAFYPASEMQAFQIKAANRKVEYVKSQTFTFAPIEQFVQEGELSPKGVIK